MQGVNHLAGSKYMGAGFGLSQKLNLKVSKDPNSIKSIMTKIKISRGHIVGTTMAMF